MYWIRNEYQQSEAKKNNFFMEKNFIPKISMCLCTHLHLQNSLSHKQHILSFSNQQLLLSRKICISFFCLQLIYGICGYSSFIRLLKIWSHIIITISKSILAYVHVDLWYLSLFSSLFARSIYLYFVMHRRDENKTTCWFGPIFFVVVQVASFCFRCFIDEHVWVFASENNDEI